MLIYVDNCITISEEKGYLRMLIKSLTDGQEKNEFSEEVFLESCLGVKFAVRHRCERYCHRVVDLLALVRREALTPRHLSGYSYLIK